MPNYSLQDLLDYDLVDREKFSAIISKTLANKGVHTIEDLFNMQDLSKYYGIGAKKAILIAELQEAIRQTPNDDIEGRIENNFKPNYLPNVCPENATIAELITSFISEFCESLKSQDDGRNSIKKNKRISIELAYLRGLSEDAIATDRNITVNERERIRQILAEFTKQVGTIILSNNCQCSNKFSRKYGITNTLLHPQFTAKMREVYDFSNTCPTDQQFANKLGCSVNSPIMNFAIKCCGKIVCSNIRSELKENFISSINANKLGRSIGIVFDKLEK